MTKNIWTDTDIAIGYESMAEINRQLAEEFAATEEEAATRNHSWSDEIKHNE